MQTLLLADSPDLLGDLFPSSLAWRRLSSDALPAPLANLWSVIGPGLPVWTAEAPASFAVGRWDSVAIVDQAPGSQFDALQSADAAGVQLPEAVACLALRGRGFHGNRERSWAVERGNLHLTVRHACDASVDHIGHGFSMLPTVGVTRALAGQAGSPGQVGIKWVNDVLIDGQKVAGALTATQVEEGRFRSVISGLGVNVERTPPIETSRFVPAAGCLADLLPVANITLPTFLPKILRSLDEVFQQLIDEGSAALLEAYRAHSCCLEKEVAVWAEDVNDFANTDPLARGRLLAINDDLSLTIEGCSEPLTRGRLALAGSSWPLGSAWVAD